jgi:hypothetical protein
MPSIGLIDDRTEQRTTLARNIRHGLESSKGWTLIERAPLEKITEYPSWIRENDMAVLVVDERLNEQAANGRPAGYEGHDVIEFLRPRLPTFPLYVVTSYEDDHNVQDSGPKVEDVVPRSHLNQDPEKYTTRLVRAGSRYWQNYQDDLAELSRLAARIASGRSTEDEVKAADAIRQQLGLAFPLADISTLSQWIGSASEEVRKLNELRERIEKHLKEQNK